MKTRALPFASLLKAIVDNRGKTCPTSEAGRPLIATNCIKQEQLYPVFENVRYISDETYASWFRGHPEPGDMVFVTKGTPGRVCWVPDPVNFCIAQDMVAIRADESKVYPKYLFAALRSQRVQDDIESLHVGSLIPHFKKGDFDKLLIQLPDTQDQKFIGDLHFAICEMVHLLYQQNQTLEQMAETLYRQWFVEEANETWSEGSLGDIAEFLNGKSRPIEEGSVPVYGGNGILAFTSRCNYSGRSIIIGRVGAYCGSLYYETKDLWVSDNALIAKAKTDNDTHYLYQMLKTLDLNSLAVGSSHPLLTQGLLKSIKISVAPKQKRELFESHVNMWYVKIQSNKEQITSLQQLRDTLLPRLMSGEIMLNEKQYAQLEKTC